MFCTQCGANNPDNAVTCANCGRNLQATPPPLPATGVVLPPKATVPNYLVFAILSTLFCCLPAGIPAIVYAAQVNGKLQAGDFAGAQEASKNAKMWCWISLAAGVGVLIIYIMLVAVGVLSNLNH